MFSVDQNLKWEIKEPSTNNSGGLKMVFRRSKPQTKPIIPAENQIGNYGALPELLTPQPSGPHLLKTNLQRQLLAFNDFERSLDAVATYGRTTAMWNPPTHSKGRMKPTPTSTVTSSMISNIVDVDRDLITPLPAQATARSSLNRNEIILPDDPRQNDGFNLNTMERPEFPLPAFAFQNNYQNEMNEIWKVYPAPVNAIATTSKSAIPPLVGPYPTNTPQANVDYVLDIRQNNYDGLTTKPIGPDLLTDAFEPIGDNWLKPPIKHKTNKSNQLKGFQKVIQHNGIISDNPTTIPATATTIDSLNIFNIKKATAMHPPEAPPKLMNTKIRTKYTRPTSATVSSSSILNGGVHHQPNDINAPSTSNLAIMNEVYRLPAPDSKFPQTNFIPWQQNGSATEHQNKDPRGQKNKIVKFSTEDALIDPYATIKPNQIMPVNVVNQVNNMWQPQLVNMAATTTSNSSNLRQNMKDSASGSGINIRNVDQVNATITAANTTAERPNAVPMKSILLNGMNNTKSISLNGMNNTRAVPYGSGALYRDLNNLMENFAAPNATATTAATNYADIDIEALLNEYLPFDRVDAIKDFLVKEWDEKKTLKEDGINGDKKNLPIDIRLNSNNPRNVAPAPLPSFTKLNNGFPGLAANPKLKKTENFGVLPTDPGTIQPEMVPPIHLGNIPQNGNKRRLPRNNGNISEWIDLTLSPERKEIVETVKEQENANYQKLLQIEESSGIIPNFEEFECTICFTVVVEKEGVMLRNCLHLFCRECISQLIAVNEPSDVKCPFIEKDQICNEILQDREIRALLTKEQYEEYLVKSLRTAENTAPDAFHCRVPNCSGWIFHDRVTQFQCPICKTTNCIACNVSSSTLVLYLNSILIAF